MTKVKFTIHKMHCGGCAAGIELLLSTLTGVKTAKIDFKAGEGIVDFDEQKVHANDLTLAIGNLGYSATELPF